VDTQTRHALKQDRLRQAAASSASWVTVHRTAVIRWSAVLATVIILGVGGLVTYSIRSTAAGTALGAALDIYNAPLAQPGAPAESGTYATAKDRAKAANEKFLVVAGQFGWMPQGTKAHYFAGITDEDLGQNAAAENELQIAAGTWNRNIANLAKLALAGLYRQTNRNAQAIDIYNAIAAKPSETVPATVAQLDLADLYASTGKQAEARALWAKVKDADKDGAAGSIAAQKLTAKQ
jgi:tetratricopeptide (TPR) repeat protein